MTIFKNFFNNSSKFETINVQFSFFFEMEHKSTIRVMFIGIKKTLNDKKYRVRFIPSLLKSDPHKHLTKVIPIQFIKCPRKI